MNGLKCTLGSYMRKQSHSSLVALGLGDHGPWHGACWHQPLQHPPAMQNRGPAGTFPHTGGTIEHQIPRRPIPALKGSRGAGPTEAATRQAHPRTRTSPPADSEAAPRAPPSRRPEPEAPSRPAAAPLQSPASTQTTARPSRGAGPPRAVTSAEPGIGLGRRARPGRGISEPTGPAGQGKGAGRASSPPGFALILLAGRPGPRSLVTARQGALRRRLRAASWGAREMKEQKD